ncbi:bis(5'-nucleosyl)-tetraphosphatase (symmetrical) YqeK [Candidatus Oleimmundimicrobium sp.]|uniref:bis(5'-nucleosyl)-tetraphosphatase (symmetrical) YqeK n=1 Tax=Candidatus Oleimmundimicrobium sp. TaxID=3060597 RepID=UPI0027202BA7|nr:bis(5'-nucleosyl)-tetraphosphatase (symmetrical) YqeK [Candidatus Oleimmundimicrobium sp.]MDO8886152.1 bis(5'-nucleosyl)-tetraphosphatase (symmetrical) YqeK [Candidatus Oleimmundimicrobium sp.]
MRYSEEKILNLLSEWLDEKLFAHSLRVRNTAKEMAQKFGVDVKKAALAGLLHDYGKGIKKTDIIFEAKKLGLSINSAEEYDPYLLHAPVGARLIFSQLGIKDTDVMQAVSRHTVGEPFMSKLDMIVYIADMIEPTRSFPGLEEIRNLEGKQLIEVFELAYAHTLHYLIRNKKLIHPKSFEVWNWIQLSKEKEIY